MTAFNCLLLSLLFAACYARDCPSYGCSMLPRDIVFDEKARKGLQKVSRDDDDGLEELKESGNENHATLTLIGYKGGELTDQINQDRYFVVSPFMKSFHLSGVFDGHGNLGEVVSEFAVTETPKRLADKLGRLKSLDDDNAIVQALKDTFVEIDRDVPTNGIGGCTASVVLQIGTKVYVANAGDSISMVATFDKVNKKVDLLFVSREDKPHLQDERARIESMGGSVWIPRNLEEESSRVIFVDPKTGYQSGLAMSRSIGDWDMTGAIAEPLVEVVDLSKLRCISDESNESCTTSSVFVISATDGMMDYIQPSDIAASFASGLIQEDGPHPLNVAEDLIHLASRGWDKDMQGEYRDDIAVVASRLIF
jgi:serine/threonine protein phosphatase PrpC